MHHGQGHKGHQEGALWYLCLVHGCGPRPHHQDHHGTHSCSGKGVSCPVRTTQYQVECKEYHTCIQKHMLQQLGESSRITGAYLTLPIAITVNKGHLGNDTNSGVLHSRGCPILGSRSFGTSKIILWREVYLLCLYLGGSTIGGIEITHLCSNGA